MKVAQPKQVMEWMNWICAASRKYRVSRSLPLRLPQIQMIIARQPLTAAHRIQRRRVQSPSAPGKGAGLVAIVRHRSQCFRSEEHTSELQSLMRISYAVFCLKKKKKNHKYYINNTNTHT